MSQVTGSMEGSLKQMLSPAQAVSMATEITRLEHLLGAAKKSLATMTRRGAEYEVIMAIESSASILAEHLYSIAA